MLDGAPQFAERTLRLLAFPFLAVLLLGVADGSSDLRTIDKRSPGGLSRAGFQDGIQGGFVHRIAEENHRRARMLPAQLAQQAQGGAISRVVFAQQEVVSSLTNEHQSFFG